MGDLPGATLKDDWLSLSKKPLTLLVPQLEVELMKPFPLHGGVVTGSLCVDSH